ncbi:MAG: hypothetical protein JW893_06385 [Candidatus Omnitrophica bacterium]|nr:hypothetical protein [Candidatus Omnitrophota bacterium]
MKNIFLLFRRILAAGGLGLFFFWVASSAFAETVKEATPFKVLENVIDEFRKPLVDPEAFKVEEQSVDPLTNKLNESRNKFYRKRQEKRNKFLQQVRKGEWDAKKLQEELAKFQQKDQKELQKFMRKQSKKLEKYLDQKGS